MRGYLQQLVHAAWAQRGFHDVDHLSFSPLSPLRPLLRRPYLEVRILITHNMTVLVSPPKASKQVRSRLELGVEAARNLQVEMRV